MADSWFKEIEPKIQKIQKTFSPYLTSADDGSHPSYTAQLLDGLKERGIHATFFVTGGHAELDPDIIERTF